MGRLITIEEYMNILAEKTYDNSRQLKRGVHQRRNGMEDLYGVCFSANGDAQHPATFYVSLSPDYVYLERFAFKFVIKPYASTVAGASSSGGGGGESGATSLAIESEVDSGTSTLIESIDPNPHAHSEGGGGTTTVTVDYGIHNISTTSTNWRVAIDGEDITAYLIAQHDGEWIQGEGVYPNDRLGQPQDFYDILEVCDVLTDLGEIEMRDKILASKFKRVEIFSDAPFGVDAYLYLKYPHANR